MCKFWLCLNNGFMMIKHQVELVNVVSADCPLHGHELEKVLSKDANKKNDNQEESIIESPSHYFEGDVLSQDEVMCLCEDKSINNLSP